jgi:pantetheine-phosphate adenylyltransferase
MAHHRIGVYPGTFDPITNGHSEIIRRAARLVDHLVVGPAINIGKGPLFTIEERVEILREDIAAMPDDLASRVSVEPFQGLLVDFARAMKGNVIFRGLRAVSDFEYEIQMASMNAKLAPEIETVFLMASERHQFIASSLVKDIGRLGGDVSHFVSPRVHKRLSTKFASLAAAKVN